eukprot:COSAG03_NODE_887_length_5485_cov_57.389157_6_plen_106_part_00
MWQRKNIGWSNNTIATWTTTYGTACTIAGLTLVPWALKNLSKSTFTVLASITVGLQTALWGVAEAGWPEWRGIPLYAYTPRLAWVNVAHLSITLTQWLCYSNVCI